jgi:formyltetrahydrofolate deformylase
MCYDRVFRTTGALRGLTTLKHAILLIRCRDKKGIVSKVSDFIFRHDGNIINSDQYSTDPTGGDFFMRLEFWFDETAVPAVALEADLAALGEELEAQWTIHYADQPLRMGVLVSKYDHCLVDLLYRHRSGEIPVQIPLIISNHPDLEPLATSYGIPFHHVPIAPETKLEGEQAILALVRDSTDFLVLARYMQIVSDGFLAAYRRDMINIHHSFLPSFKGANPYRQAYDRGVKVIGATSHFVTPQLDEGPIIEQVVDRVYYKDTLEDLKRKGRNLEKEALANAIRAYASHRIMRVGQKTIVFE